MSKKRGTLAKPLTPQQRQRRRAIVTTRSKLPKFLKKFIQSKTGGNGNHGFVQVPKVVVEVMEQPLGPEQAAANIMEGAIQDARALFISGVDEAKALLEDSQDESLNGADQIDVEMMTPDQDPVLKGDNDPVLVAPATMDDLIPEFTDHVTIASPFAPQ